MKPPPFELSVIIPLRASGLDSIDGLRGCIEEILARCPVEVILIDQCDEWLYSEIGSWFNIDAFVHLRVDRRYRDAANQKMAAVLTALGVARGDKVCILDDDFRPSPAEIARVAAELERVDCVRCGVFYRTFTWAALSSTCTRYVKSAATSIYDEGYEPAHICFTRRALDASGAPPADVLFDDLAILRHFRRAGFPPHLLRDVVIEKRPPGLGKFWEQRFRYAYEELAYPALFAVYVASVPLLLLATRVSRVLAIVVFLIPSLIAFSAALCEYLASPDRGRSAGAVAYAPIWYWLTAIFVWTVPFVWLRGGCRFGDRRIRKVV